MQQKTMNQRDRAKVGGSFREKSAGISLVVIAVIAIYYGVNLYELFQAGVSQPTGIWQLALGTLILIIVVEAVLQIVLVIGAGHVSAITQRDQDVALKAKRNAYTLLVVGVLATFGSLFFGATSLVMAHLALLAFVLAELTKYASQLVYYRQAA
jgi:hypothetical protein